MRGLPEWAERHQIALALLAVGVGLGLGLLPFAPASEPAVPFVLGSLLFATFLGIPFERLLAALRDLRFLLALLVLNAVLVPLLVFGLSRVVAHDQALLIGVLLVLLTPCVDYVVVFAGIAGGDRERLLAATPLLMLGQLLLMPVGLLLFGGGEALAVIDVRPFAEAFIGVILVPLLLAAAVRASATRSAAVRHASEQAMRWAMVPLLMLVLALVAASQLHRVLPQAGTLIGLVPLYLAFAAGAVLLGVLTARVGRLSVAPARAVVFSGLTRNSLVVLPLPLALALPEALTVAAAAVVLQTIVELVVMPIAVRVVPRLLPAPSPAA